MVVVIGSAPFISAGIIVIRIVRRRVVAAVAVRIPIIVGIESGVIDEPEAVDEMPLGLGTMRSALRAPCSVRRQIDRAVRSGMREPQRVLELDARPWQSLRHLHLRDDRPLSLGQSWPRSRGARPNRT